MLVAVNNGVTLSVTNNNWQWWLLLRGIQPPESGVEKHLHQTPQGTYQLRYRVSPCLRQIDPSLPPYIERGIATTSKLLAIQIAKTVVLELEILIHSKMR